MSSIDFSRTIDKALVHRRAVAEVLATSAIAADDGTYLVGVQVPRMHAFFGDALHPHSSHDALLFLEALRQAGYAVVHLFRGVPLDRSFVLRDIAVSITEPDLIDNAGALVDAVVRVHINREFRGRDKVPIGVRLTFELLVDGRVAGEGGVSASWVTPPAMAEVRRSQREQRGLPASPVPCPAPARIAPELVNRRTPRNVVISDLQDDEDGGHRAELVVDTTHPTLFDHPVDHVPGLLEIEACRQTAVASAIRDAPGHRAWSLDAVSARFHEFAEYDLPVFCQVTAAGVVTMPDGSARHRYTARAVQRGLLLTEADLTLTCSALAVTAAAPLVAAR
jgi:hypothetical protein